MSDGKVSLTSQIAAIEFALGGNGPTYRSHAHRELHHRHLAAALKMLRFVEHHQSAIRDAIARVSE